MEFPPSFPLLESVPAVVTGDDPSSSSVWDWGNLLDFAIDADDSFILSDLPHLPSPQPPPLEETPPQAEPAPEGSSSRVRKRDPRLVCANYLAGRVPCACPEVDEKEMEGDEEEAVVGGRKRARAGVVNVGVRCQVPGCEVDIGELKGYHRRHRVCLRCAYAPSVMIEGETKRYCQQCGKFHVLLDFDEDKRSCRRKLERHNRRRRRKPADLKSVVEKENVCQGKQLGETQKESTCTAVEDDGVRNKLVDGDMLLDCQNGLGCDEPSSLGLENTQTDSPRSFATSVDAIVDDERLDKPKSTISSTTCDNKSTYSSVCPTGRISFKLYDWNPAEFPRRLRHQIFEWLASMPVELEGYVRPGCTILTLFIAMPKYMWVKLSQDGEVRIKQLINAPESLLMGRGNILIYLSNVIIQILKDGTSHINVMIESKAPRLHCVQPTYFEAGKAMEFIACGSNLDQPNLRFLVSFAGRYLVCDVYRVMSHRGSSYCGNSCFSMNNSEHELFAVNVKQTVPEVFGPAFIEVENESGVSNFIPVLIGDKQICHELESLQGIFTRSPSLHVENIASSAVCGDTATFRRLNFTQQIDMSDLLLDIAWLLKEPCEDTTEYFWGSLNVERVVHLLRFAIQNDLISVLKAVVRYVDIGFSKSMNLSVDADTGLLLNYMKNAKEILNQKRQHMEISVQDPWHVRYKDTLPVDPSAISAETPKNLNEGERNAFAFASTSAADNNESTLIITKDINSSKSPCSLLRSYWPCKFWAVNTSSTPVTRTRADLFVTATLSMCFVVCILLLNPHKPSDFSDYMRRRLLGHSNHQ
ncbi:Squamosa promoter-binding-like protein 9 [Apostasia shenzhenica]|uniref:Squamosa promoter-binding-like protein 9 n=1 Tax=Apostasia shenzhenica TaxID=1088818 RepID=A0A2I0AZC9_9ASPA|nr:Squamosa promoter-binding-like protein 9 [Apostasia shenzhenica]